MDRKWKMAALLLAPLTIVGAFLAFGVLLFSLMFFLLMDEPAQNQNGFSGGAISELGQNEIPAEFIPVYEAAAEQYGVPWNLLAAVHRVETVFSSIEVMESYAGAIGHMQFMPCTWTGWGHPSCSGLGAGNIPQSELQSLTAISRYGGLGIDGDGDGKADPFSLTDAVFSAASYLAQNGAANGDYRSAVFAYNHSQEYVTDVLGFMEAYVDYESVELVEGVGGFNRPLNTKLNSGFGHRYHPVDKVWKLHGGIDFDCDGPVPIPASKSGVVTYAGWMDANNPKVGYGLYVWVDHGGGFKTTYAHLSSIGVSVGDVVQAGQIVGRCGSTGTSTGDHLHFEIFKNGTLVDPAPYVGL